MPISNAKQLRFILFAAVPFILILLFEAACFKVPVHVTPEVEGPGGKGTLAQPATIQAGKSNREEVKHSWKWCEVRTNLNELFLCQVNRSNSREVAGILGIPLEASRNWDEEFLFVEFDKGGTVSKTYFATNSHLMRALVKWISRTPQSPLDLSQPVKLAAQISLNRRGHGVSFPGWVQLSQDAVVLQPTEGTESTVRLEPSQLRKLNLSDNSGVSLLVD